MLLQQQALPMEPLGALLDDDAQPTPLSGLVVVTHDITAQILGFNDGVYELLFAESDEPVHLPPQRLVQYLADHNARLLCVFPVNGRKGTRTRNAEKVVHLKQPDAARRKPRTNTPAPRRRDHNLLEWLDSVGACQRSLKYACRKAGLQYALYEDAYQEMRIVLNDYPHEPHKRNENQAIAYAQRICINIALRMRCKLQGPCSIPPDAFFEAGEHATGVELDEGMHAESEDTARSLRPLLDDPDAQQRLSSIHSAAYRDMALSIIDGQSAAECARQSGIKPDSIRRRIARLTQTIKDNQQVAHVE